MENPVNERFILIRKNLKMNQTAMARTLGVTPSTVSYIENGGPLSMDMLEKISVVHNVNKSYLLDGEGKMFKDGTGPTIPSASGGWGELVAELKSEVEDLRKDKERLWQMLLATAPNGGNNLGKLTGELNDWREHSMERSSHLTLVA